MLERFEVPLEDQVRVPEAALRQTVTDIFRKMGVPDDQAKLATDVLVYADLRGVETHGVSNMLRIYIDYYRAGTMNPTPEWKIEREAPATATIDGDRGLGIALGPSAMQLAIDKAKQCGVGVVTMNNSRHLGAVGYHAMMAAEQDCIGMCLTAAGLVVVPTFGTIARLGTNPISIAAPTNSEVPFLFDAATCAIAANKVGLAARVGAPLEPGWITDADGEPILEAKLPPPKGQFKILPLGGTREQGSHKGYGLAMMVETLCAILSGSRSLMNDADSGYKHYFAAYDVKAFCDVDEFKTNMDDMLRTLQDTPPAKGHERVVYPGIEEHEALVERQANGIPLHKEVIDWFGEITAELQLPVLETK